jgi:hypothetical protein
VGAIGARVVVQTQGVGHVLCSHPLIARIDANYFSLEPDLASAGLLMSVANSRPFAQFADSNYAWSTTRVPTRTPRTFAAEPPLMAISRKPLDPTNAIGLFGGTA